MDIFFSLLNRYYYFLLSYTSHCIRFVVIAYTFSTYRFDRMGDGGVMEHLEFEASAFNVELPLPLL